LHQVQQVATLPVTISREIKIDQRNVIGCFCLQQADRLLQRFGRIYLVITESSLDDLTPRLVVVYM
jgi:hypothetical protein